MAGKGGYQAPANPAPTSGPGALSRRTDGGLVQKLRALPDAQYGEGKQFMDEQRAAPLAQTPANIPGGNGQGAQPGGPDLHSMAVPLSAPTQRPDEPVTAGANAGAGPDSSALGLSDQSQQNLTTTRDYLNQLAATTGNTAVQYLAAAANGSL